MSKRRMHTTLSIMSKDISSSSGRRRTLRHIVTFAGSGIENLDHPRFIRHLAVQIIPFVGRVEVDVIQLANGVGKDQVRRHQVLRLDGCKIAQCQRAVEKWAEERTPNTGASRSVHSTSTAILVRTRLQGQTGMCWKSEEMRHLVDDLISTPKQHLSVVFVKITPNLSFKS